MQIRIKLMGMLKSKSPPDGVLEIADQATIANVLAALEIPAQSVQVFTVNGSLERNRDRILSPDDEFSALPPVGGG
jgi:sulfur carrier protein ThiS